MARNDSENLAMLGVASAVLLASMNADGKFQYWDILPGLLLCSILLANTGSIAPGFCNDVAMSIMLGGGLLMIFGWVIEPFISMKAQGLPNSTDPTMFRNNWLACIWSIFAASCFVARSVSRKEDRNG